MLTGLVEIGGPRGKYILHNDHPYSHLKGHHHGQQH
nr:MAG TPA: hypothetical protein [Caudoviricetes sp.]